MHFRLTRAGAVAVLLALAFGASGCIVREPRGEIVAMRAPPPPRVEVVPAPPRDAVEWEPGHWHWDGREYRWMPGCYVDRPGRAAVYVPGHWDERPNGRWVWVEVHWR